MDIDFSPSPEAPALVIGAAGVDIVGRLREDLHRETSNPAQIRTSFGGVARNVAENLVRLGQPVRLIAAVGDDQVGDQLVQDIASSGVDVSAVLRSQERPTGAYLAVVNTRGEMQFALDDMRIISAVSPEYLEQNAALFEQSSLLFVDANLSQAALRTAVHLARKARIPICADPTSFTLAHRLRPFLPHLHLITPNSAEASILCGHEVEDESRREAIEAAKELVTQGIEVAVITLAKFGVCYATSEISGYIRAIRSQIVNPTGAGDALTAAVIFALLNDIPIDDAIRLGVSAASLTLRVSETVRMDLSLEKLYDELVI